MHILIIEDDSITGEYIRQILTKPGRQIKSVGNAEDALKFLKEKTPDLMIVDYKLPDMTGASFIVDLKTRNMQVPDFIVTTGFGDERTAVEMMKLGAVDYILKNRHFGELLPEVVNKTLDAISKKKELTSSQKKLHESEKRFRHFANLLPECIFEADDNLNIIFANDIGLKMFGYTAKDIESGLNALSLIAEEQRHLPQILIKQRIEGNRLPAQEYTGIRKDGSRFAMLLNTMPIIENGIYKGIRGILIDDSERKKANAKFQNIFNSVSNGIVYITLDGTVTDINPAAEEILRIPKSVIIGHEISDLARKYLDKENSQILINLFNEESDSSESSILTLKYRDRIIQINANTDLEIGKITCVLEDITERQKHEAETLKYNRELEKNAHDLRRANKELEKAKLKAEESDRLKSAFLANMSHEIRTPMNSVSGFSHMLKEPNISPENISKFADIIIKSSDYLLELINDIIDISKLEAGKVSVISEPVDINEMIGEIETILRVKIKNSNPDLLLRTVTPKENLVIISDSLRLRQVIINLTDNALKFTHSGYIEIGYDISDDKIIFKVKDTGIGIPEDKQDIIFERFRQVADTTEKLYGGTGLGLAIAKACVEMLGGEIRLKSKEGNGSVFYFSLDYTPAEGHIPDNKHRLPPSSNFNGEHILIAEDNPENIEYIKSILENTGLKTSYAENGEEAVEIFEKHDDIKLILMDIRMPKMNGYQAAEKIFKLNPDIPIIAQTAYALPPDKRKSKEAGFAEHIEKPVKPKVLLETVKKYLS